MKIVCYNTRMQKQHIIKTVTEKRASSPRGEVAYFVPLGGKWAIKLFKHAGKRDKVYDRQKLAAAHDMAPEVGDKVNLPDSDGSGFCYGYITEVIHSVEGQWKKDLAKNPDIREHDWDKKWISQYKQEKIAYVCKLMDIIDLVGDAHSFNFGFKNGKLMMLDFGMDSEEDCCGEMF